jgi:hypothetical protein
LATVRERVLIPASLFLLLRDVGYSFKPADRTLLGAGLLSMAMRYQELGDDLRAKSRLRWLPNLVLKGIRIWPSDEPHKL